jgi:hypothetical protein
LLALSGKKGVRFWYQPKCGGDSYDGQEYGEGSEETVPADFAQKYESNHDEARYGG